MNAVKVNDLLLPEVLSKLIAEGRWVPPNDDRIQEVFGERPSQANFYSFEDMKLENDAWSAETLPEYLGEPDDQFPPGNLDPRSSILIGDLGHDLPFGLDYRLDQDRPRVVFLGTKVDGRWTTVAENIDELLAQLDIS